MLPFELTKDTPYLALSGELWSVFYEYFNRNWSCYKGFLLYFGGTTVGTDLPIRLKFDKRKNVHVMPKMRTTSLKILIASSPYESTPL